VKTVDKARLAHSPYHAAAARTARLSMIRRSGAGFPKKIMLKVWEKQFLLQCTCKIQRTV
jgi:hypothetical protein